MRHRSATRSASRGGNLSRISRYWAQAESFPSRRTTLPSTKKIFPHIGRVSAAWTLVWDRDTDTVYVSRTHRLRETLEGAGVASAAQYREQGLNLFVERIQPLRRRHGQKSVSVEAGLMDMLNRMQSGRFKVFKHLNDWWEEFRLYHRKDGKVVKEGDDLMCATRYALMMLRFAQTVR